MRVVVVYRAESDYARQVTSFLHDLIRLRAAIFAGHTTSLNTRPLSH